MEWRDIKGYEGYYQVSNTKNVKHREMKFQVGDRIKYVHKDYWFLRNHFGAVGQIVDQRSYGKSARGNVTHSHYVVKWDCYTIPHIFTKHEIESCCEKVDGVFQEMDECVNEFMDAVDKVVKKPKIKQSLWKKYPQEKPTHMGDYLIRGIGGWDNKFHHWLCFWADVDGIPTNFYYNGNEFRCTEKDEFEFLDVNDIQDL